MAAWQQDIQRNQTVWTEQLGNGVILDIDWVFKTVLVDFYEKGHETFEFDDLIGNFDEGLNQWVITTI